MYLCSHKTKNIPYGKQNIPQGFRIQPTVASSHRRMPGHLPSRSTRSHLAYASGKEIPELSPTAAATFAFIKKELEENCTRHDRRLNRQRVDEQENNAEAEERQPQTNDGDYIVSGQTKRDRFISDFFTRPDCAPQCFRRANFAPTADELIVMARETLDQWHDQGRLPFPNQVSASNDLRHRLAFRISSMAGKT